MATDEEYDEFEDELNEYFGMFPPRREHPPFFPELTVALDKIPTMLEECAKLQSALSKALATVKAAQQAAAVDASPRAENQDKLSGSRN